jgi:hypothetical protein
MATLMLQVCAKLNGKRLNDYRRLKSTKEFFNVLSGSAGIPADLILQITKTGPNDKRGTWIEPHAAINLAQWCSPEFAVMVTKWVFELLKTGSVSLNPEQSKQKANQLVQAKSNELDRKKIVGNAKRIALNSFIKEQFGYDTLAMFELESQPAEIQQALLIPTLIAEQTGLQGARAVNLKLIQLGLQTKHYDHKEKIYYQLTEKGLKYGQYQDFTTGKTSSRRIKWYENVLELFPPTLLPITPPQSNLQLF